MITHHIYLDFNKLNDHLIVSGDATHRLKQAYEVVGGEFWNEQKTILKGAKIFLCGVGGLLLENKADGTYLMDRKLDKGVLKSYLMQMAGASAFMSYLNCGNLELEKLGEKVVNFHQHTSVLHPLSLNIVIIGHSIGVEHEFASQRDILHLSRLTVAKTSVQDYPCLTLRDPLYLSLYEAVLKKTEEQIKSAGITHIDKETQNLLFPAAKASMIMLSGSLKNFYKLIALKDTGGKEQEFIDLLEDLKNVLDYALA